MRIIDGRKTKHDLLPLFGSHSSPRARLEGSSGGFNRSANIFLRGGRTFTHDSAIVRRRETKDFCARGVFPLPADKNPFEFRHWNRETILTSKLFSTQQFASTFKYARQRRLEA